MTFGESACRLMAAAAVLLGWRPAEFWAATPAELAAIFEILSHGAGTARAGMDSADLARLKEMCRDGG